MSKPMQIRKVAVLGAGVMGAQIAAQLVNANVPVLLFDLPSADGDANAIANRAIVNLLKLDPAPLASANKQAAIIAANYQHDLARLTECDLVIEAIAERLDWKCDLYQKVAASLSPNVIFASNTSGLSINALAQAFPAQLRHRFCGIHFFNPPRYMHLVELIAGHDTDPALLDPLESFLVSSLGKGVVRAKDTPNFIANRIGVFSLLATLYHAQRLGIGFDTVDALSGRYLGRPKSATFRTLDVVGLDTFAHVVNTLQSNLPSDPWAPFYTTPDWLSGLINKGALGQKSGAGIYQKQGKAIRVLDLASQQYRDSNKELDESVKELLRERDWSKKLAGLRDSKQPQAQLVWAMFRDLFHYCAVHLESIADSARDVDFAIRWGFGWDLGPFEIWQQVGWQQVAAWIEQERAQGLTMSHAPLPDWVMRLDAVHQQQGSYAPAVQQWLLPRLLPVHQRQLYPDHLCHQQPVYGHTIFETETVRMWHGDDDIAILSFSSKMHVINNDTLNAIQRAVREAEANWRGLVIWQTEPPFSAGANLLQLMQGVQPEAEQGGGLFGKLKQAATRVKYTVAGGGGLSDALHAATGDVPKVEDVVANFQRATQCIKYAQVPVVAAVDGLALGGGCEIIMHTARVVASLESYIGLVEVGVGLLPAGGGCKEASLRLAQEAQAIGSGDLLPFLKRYFNNIAMGEVAKSAEQAREMGYLRAADRIVLNRFEVLYLAKQEVLNLTATDYHPPLPATRIPVAGRTGRASLQMLMVNMLEGGFISEHDYAIGCAVADTLCGGDVDAGTLVDETWLLELERRHFMTLLATDKTKDRIEYMLKNGKPLRN